VIGSAVREWMVRQPLLALFAGVMPGLALPMAVLLAADDRTLLEVAIWAKPLKFTLLTPG
jgi:hypothetical protein